MISKHAQNLFIRGAIFLLLILNLKWSIYASWSNGEKKQWCQGFEIFFFVNIKFKVVY